MRFLQALTAIVVQTAICMTTHAATPVKPVGAEAVNSANPTAPIRVNGQPNLFRAATEALKVCQETYGAEGYCELTRVGDLTITTAESIKERVPTDRHPLFLWEYAQPNATVYLAGSVHILKQGLYPLPVQLDAALEKADYLALEIDSSQYSPTELAQTTQRYALLPAGQNLQTVLDEALYARLARKTAEYGIPLGNLSAFKPSFLTQQLALLAFVSAGYDPTIGVEQYLTKRAGDKRLLELESLEFQLDLLMNQPMDIQVQMVRDTLDQFDEFESITSDLMTAWFSGDDAGFLELSHAQAGISELSAAFMRKLMDERNVGMAQKVAQYLASEGTYLVVVGAAHLIGENSVVALLAKRGLEGRRLYSTDAL